MELNLVKKTKLVSIMNLSFKLRKFTEAIQQLKLIESVTQIITIKIVSIVAMVFFHVFERIVTIFYERMDICH